MNENLKLARLYFLLLAIFTVGRWLQGTFGVPYENGHQVFSIVTLTALSSIYYGAFCRRWRNASILQAAVLGMTLGVASQIVIFLATMASYALGLQTYFNHRTALNSKIDLAMGEAFVRRLVGLVTNTLSASLGGALGWAMGALLPQDNPSAR